MHEEHGAQAPSLGRLTTSATTHCLIGCAIGQWIGLAIGVSVGLNAWPTMALATVLGFIGGYRLGLWPLVRQGMSWTRAFRTIWLGETISIAVMEFVMNFTDYHVGGVQAPSLLAPQFWLGYAAAVPAGFMASQFLVIETQHQAALPLIDVTPNNAFHLTAGLAFACPAAGECRRSAAIEVATREVRDGVDP